VKVIMGGRQAGKTTALVEKVRGGVQRPDGSWSRVIVTHSEREAEWLRREHDLDKRQVLSSDEWGRNRFGGRDHPDDLLVDNLDHWLLDVFGRMPSAATSTFPIWVDSVLAARAEQRAVDSALSAFDGDDLIEDEDGAPYPEPVQALARELRLKMREVDGLLENMQRQLVRQQNHAARQEDGLLGMMGALVAPKSSPPTDG
jgi:hypothetical protein